LIKFATSFQKIDLIRNKSIRSLVAALMLALFAFSTTPTIVLHNWFANHKDSIRKLPDNSKERIGKRLFNCHCDNIVAESPFTEPGETIVSPPLQEFLVEKADEIFQLIDAPSIFYPLRGPPLI